MFDWRRRCAYDGAQKKLFHAKGRAALRALAKELRLSPHPFTIRSCEGGVAISGEIILHGESIYIQISQPATGADSGVPIRSGPAALAAYVRAVMSGDLLRISAMFGPLAVKRQARGRG